MPSNPLHCFVLFLCCQQAVNILILVKIAGSQQFARAWHNTLPSLYHMMQHSEVNYWC